MAESTGHPLMLPGLDAAFKAFVVAEAAAGRKMRWQQKIFPVEAAAGRCGAEHKGPPQEREAVFRSRDPPVPVALAWRRVPSRQLASEGESASLDTVRDRVPLAMVAEEAEDGGSRT